MISRTLYSHTQNRPSASDDGEWLDELLQLQVLDARQNVLQLVVHGDPHDISLVPVLISAFEKLQKRGFQRLLLDMHNLDNLSPSLIVFMLEATARLRRSGREFSIIHLNESARRALDRFKPSQFLSLAQDIEEIVAKFREEETAQDLTTVEPPAQPLATPAPQDSNFFSIKIPSKVAALYKACDFVTNLADQVGFNETDQGKIKIAVYEACLNVIEHAYHSNPNRIVQVDVKKQADGLMISVIDHGQGFRVDNADDFNVVEAALKRKTGGMGLHIIRKSMDRVYYQVDPVKGNSLVMDKYLTPPPAATTSASTES
ncbi:ATP-binding protein [candidate division KSB1 bacterium]|nr:ATP-binding protein [candidate division KSB1 bacterium]